MVLNKKGQFMLDLAFAVLIYSLIIFYTISTISIIIGNGTTDFREAKTRSRLFDASEVMLTNPNVTYGGLALYEENSVKHHELDIGKFGDFLNSFAEIKQRLLLEGMDVFVRITTEGGKTLLEAGKPINGSKVSRVALCGGESCVVEIIAK